MDTLKRGGPRPPPPAVALHRVLEPAAPGRGALATDWAVDLSRRYGDPPPAPPRRVRLAEGAGIYENDWKTAAGNFNELPPDKVQSLYKGLFWTDESATSPEEYYRSRANAFRSGAGDPDEVPPMMMPDRMIEYFKDKCKEAGNDPTKLKQILTADGFVFKNGKVTEYPFPSPLTSRRAAFANKIRDAMKPPKAGEVNDGTFKNKWIGAQNEMDKLKGQLLNGEITTDDFLSKMNEQKYICDDAYNRTKASERSPPKGKSDLLRKIYDGTKEGVKGVGKYIFGKDGLSLLTSLIYLVGGLASFLGLIIALMNKDGGTCSIKQFPYATNETQANSVKEAFKELIGQGPSKDGFDVGYVNTGPDIGQVYVRYKKGIDDLKKILNQGAYGSKISWTVKEESTPNIIWVNPDLPSKETSSVFKVSYYPAKDDDCKKIMRDLSATSYSFDVNANCCKVWGGIMSKQNCCNQYCRINCKGTADCGDCYEAPSFWSNLKKTMSCMPPYGLMTGCWQKWLPAIAHWFMIAVGVVIILVVLGLIVWVVVKSVHSHTTDKIVVAAAAPAPVAAKVAGGGRGRAGAKVTDSLVALFRKALPS